MANSPPGNQPDKTGWDKATVIFQGIGALAIPISIIVLIIQIGQFNAQQQSAQQQALIQQEQMALQTYLDDMTKLIFDDKLGSQAVADKATSAEAAVIARAKTIVTLSHLTDPQRKATVVQFLYESGLIKKPLNNGDKSNPILDMSYADLSGAYLKKVDLHEADLEFANLSGADLTGAKLEDADLLGTNLSGAKLSGVYLSDAALPDVNLNGAHLENAHLQGANLSCADLRGAFLIHAFLSDTTYLGGANLKGANVSGSNLSDVQLKSLAIKPDGTEENPVCAIV